MHTKSNSPFSVIVFDNLTSPLAAFIVLLFIFQAGPVIASPPGALYETFGTTEGDLGGPLANIGDVNNDGFMDFAVRGNPVPDGVGEVRLYFGGPLLGSAPNLTIPSPMVDPGDGFSVLEFGSSISGGGDLNGDGIDDLVIGTDNLLTTGFVFVYFGGSWTDVLPDAILSGFYDDDRFGQSVAIIGDVNDDSIDDLAVGTYNFSLNSSAYVYFGGNGYFDNAPDLQLHEEPGEGEFAVFGSSVAAVGDFNGDNVDDFLVTSQFGGNDHNGRVYLYLGGSSIDNVHDLRFADTFYNGYFGGGTSAGDFNGDGFDDVAISDSESGRVLVFEGQSITQENKNQSSLDKALTPSYPGPSRQVNTSELIPRNPNIAIGPNGKTVVCWQQRDTSTSQDNNIFVRHLDQYGVPFGPAIQVNTYTAGDQYDPKVAVDAKGNFVVVWASGGWVDGDEQDGSYGGVYGQLFDSTGTMVGGEFLVNSTTLGSQGYPALAMAPDGSFVVVWQLNRAGTDFGVFGKIYDQWGTDISGEITIASSLGFPMGGADVSMFENNGFLVSWGESAGNDSGITKVRLYDSQGQNVGDEIPVTDPPAASIFETSVFTKPDGSFGVLWIEVDIGIESAWIRGQLFDSNAAKTGDRITIFSNPCRQMGNLDVGADEDGNFVVSWRSQCLTSPIYHQLFLADGTPMAPPVQFDDWDPAIAVGPSGGFNQVWTQLNPLSIQSRRYDTDCNGNGTADLVDVEQGTSKDLNANGIPDECEDDIFTEFVISNGDPGNNVTSVAGDFDVDGDGYDDLVISFSSYLSDPSSHGEIHLFRGGEFFDQIPVTSIYGTNQYEYLGRSLAPFSDLDGDGFLDILASSSEDPRGAVFGLSFNLYLPPVVTIDEVTPITQNVGPIPITATFYHQSTPLAPSPLWSKVSGPGKVIFSNPESMNIEANFNIAGTYVLRLTVATERGKGFDDVTIVIPPAVSIYGLTNPGNTSQFLVRPPLVDESVANSYYLAIDPDNDKDDFGKWKTANGFPDSIPTVSVAQGSDCCTGSAFFNAGDLGFGRRMIMAKTGPDYAYSVTNYATVEDAVDDINPVATVSMEWSPGPQGGSSFTKFYIFQDLNGDGTQTRVTGADLDGNGSKNLPGLCISCHGGTENPTSYMGSGITGAYFLPFDLEAFDFSTRPGVRREDMEAAFKEFNEGILHTAPTLAISDLIEGWYGGPDMPLPYQDNRYVPQGWLCEPVGSPQFPQDSLKEFYQGVIGPSCRVCHSSRTGVYDFMEATDFISWRSTIDSDVFTQGSMPHAKVTYDNFWNSTLPYQPDLMKNALLNLPQNADCVSAVDDGQRADIPLVSRISDVYPNPFNPRTTIRFELSAPGTARIRIYDVKGHLVRTLDQDGLAAGRHKATWAGLDNSGKRAASGSYFVRLDAGGQVSTQRLTMLK